MLRKTTLAATAIASVLCTPAVAQDVDVLLGGRVTEDDSALGYLSVTGKFGTAGASGFILRGEAEFTTTDFAGFETDQEMQRLLLGYSFVTDTGTFNLLAGPTHVKRSTNGGPSTISETGAYAGVEGYGFIGQRGFWAGIAQYSTPDEAFYTRAFTTYLVGGNTNIGPDISYLDEPGFERATLGLRTTWTFDDNAVAVIAGMSRESGVAGPSDDEGFLELQIGLSF